MHRRVITEYVDTPKTSGLWLVIEHFYGLKQVLTANSLHSIQQGHICVLEREFGPLDPYFLKTTHKLPFVGGVSLQYLGTFVTFVEPY